MINLLNMAQSSAVSLNAAIPKTVEITVDMLETLQRFAWFGRFTLIVLLGALGIAALVTLIKFIAYRAVKDGCGKCNRYKVKETAEKVIINECGYLGTITEAIQKEIKSGCNFGAIYKAIEKEINDSCRFGEIYMLAKHGEVPKKHEDDTDDLAWLDDEELSESDDEDDDSLSEE